jgi:signal transduction histidine kinase
VRLRGNLFTRIFIGFWLATITILASWMVTSHYFDAAPDRIAAAQPPPGPPQRFVLRTIYDLQTLGEAEIRSLVARVKSEQRVDIFLLDRQGQDILGREVPADVQRVAAELRGARRRAFLNTADRQLLAHDIYRRERGVLRAVFVFQPPAHNLLGILGSNLWLRIGLAVGISGLVCLALSRVMTRRLKELQQASRQLATGDLDTRLQVRDRGGDETDELARDFNSMAEQLQERIKAQKRLLADVSHELRSPLARLRIALALAQENPEKTADYLQRIERETERLEALIGQLLATQANDTKLDSQVDLVPLLQELCLDATFEGTANGKQVVLEHHLTSAPVASSGDLLYRSFDNILRNALSHTRPNTGISVQLEEDQAGYRISVSDHGGGVPAEELGKIFEPFYRIDTARTRDSGGLGLGLAIARRAITRHGGRIWAENTDSGLAVIVVLPMQE